MVNSGSSFTFASKTEGQIIEVAHFTTLESAVNLLATEFNTSVTKKLTLFTATTAAASLNIPGGVAPTTPATGDLWHVASTGELKLRTVNGTKTVAFTDSNFSTLSVTSLTLGSTSLTSTAATFAGTVTVKGATTHEAATTLQTASTSALLVRAGTTTDTNLLTVNGTAKTVNLLNGTDMQVFADNAATAAKLTIDGATGNLDGNNLKAAGTVEAVGNISTTTGNISTGSTGTITAGSGGFKLASEATAYAAPSKLNTGGFTIVIGNGTDAITSAIVDIPAVILPYDCTATALYLYDTNNTASSIDLKVQRAAWVGSGTPSFVTITGGTIALSSTIYASKTISVAFSQNDIIRVRINSGTPTAKQIALHVRVVRS